MKKTGLIVLLFICVFMLVASVTAAEKQLTALQVTEKITGEWQQSGKAFTYASKDLANPEATNYSGGATRTPCSDCHDGFVFSTGVFDEARAFEGNATAFDCQACHTGAGAELIKSGIVDASMPQNKGSFITENFEAGSGALCITCHNNRRNPTDLVAKYKQGESAITLPHHEGGAASLFTGKGGAELPGVTYASSTAHTNLEDSCVTCHMPKTSEGYMSHTFAMEPAYIGEACGSCHVGAKDYNINGFQDEVAAKLEVLKKAIMEDVGIATLEYDGHNWKYADAAGTEIDKGAFSQEAYAAFYNFIMIQDDGSLGIHNPRYTMSLIDESYKALTGNPMP